MFVWSSKRRNMADSSRVFKQYINYNSNELVWNYATRIISLFWQIRIAGAKEQLM